MVFMIISFCVQVQGSLCTNTEMVRPQWGDK